MILTKFPFFLHASAGSTPWSAPVLRFFRRSSPISPATPIQVMHRVVDPEYASSDTELKDRASLDNLCILQAVNRSKA